MSDQYETPIKRLEDGSIDNNYYLQLGARARSKQFEKSYHHCRSMLSSILTSNTRSGFVVMVLAILVIPEMI